ncbi:hypothetical protein EWI61_06575 [Methylolobus aquaticus]|nr:hypothetical protein EWI61_06575 [Methylolobus aquaticus]
MTGKRFLKTVAIYGVGQIGNKVVDLVSFTILVGALTQEQLGFVGTMMLLGFALTDLASIGLFRIAVPRFVLEKDQDRSAVLRNGLGGFCIYSFVVAFILSLCITGLLWFDGRNFVIPFTLYVASFWMRALVYMELEVLRMEQRPVLQSLAEAVPSILNLLSLSLLMPASSDHLVTSGLSQFIGSAVPFLGSFGAGIRRGSPAFSLLPALLRYSAPVVLHRSMAEVNQMGGRWIALVLFGLQGAGIYTFLSRVADILKMILAPIQKGWLPLLLRGAREEAHKKVGNLAVIYMTLACSGLIVFLLCHDLIARMIDKSGAYREYYEIIPWVALGTWVTSYYMVFGVGFLVAKKTSQLVPLTTIAASINLIGGYFFAKWIGIPGIPIAAIVSSIFFVVSTLIFARRYFRILYRPARYVAIATLLAGGLGVFARIFAKEFWLWSYPGEVISEISGWAGVALLSQ